MWTARFTSISRRKKPWWNGRQSPEFSSNSTRVAARLRPGLAIYGSSTQHKLHCRGRTAMQIKKHDKSSIVKLEDGSSWRIWPGDIALTLGWLPTTVLEVSQIDDEFCSHALIDKTDGSRVRVIEASKDWPVQQVRQSLKKG